MHELYELKEMLMRELNEYARKGEMSAGSLEVVDKLTHTIKNLCKIIEGYESEGQYSGENRGNSSYYREGNGTSYYARGRGRNASRDSRGRYSSNGNYYGAMEDMTSKLDELMEEAPDEKIRMEIQKLKSKVEQMQ